MGLHLKGTRLELNPCLPDDWGTFKIHYRYRKTFYHIVFEKLGNSDQVMEVILDGRVNFKNVIDLIDDQKDHQVVVRLGGDS